MASRRACAAAMLMLLVSLTSNASARQTPASVQQASQQSTINAYLATSDYDTNGTCQTLQSSFGVDVCGQLSADFDSGNADSLSDQPPACFNFDYGNPDDSSTVVQMLQYALFTDPLSCFASFNQYCDYDYADDQSRLEAFGNWTQTYAVLSDYYIKQPNGQLLTPDCLFTIYPYDAVLADRTGFSPDGNAPDDTDIVEYDTSYPARLDWAAEGMVMPVTNQAAETCFLHAAVGWAASYFLRVNDASVAGTWHFGNRDILSWQPLIDCGLPNIEDYDSTPCGPGLPEDVLNLLVTQGTTVATFKGSSYYPTVSGSPAPADNDGVESLVSCQNPSAPASCKILSNTTSLWKLPEDVVSQIEVKSRSEAQVVKALQSGPVIAGLAAGSLMGQVKLVGADGGIKPITCTIAEAAEAAAEAADPNLPQICYPKVSHAVLLIGYDMTDPSNAYFIFRNSWNTTWGDSGNGYLAMSNPSSATFTDVTNPGSAGVLQRVYF